MKIDSYEMFKVLSVETRIRIIELLKSKGPLVVKNIAKAKQFPQIQNIISILNFIDYQ